MLHGRLVLWGARAGRSEGLGVGSHPGLLSEADTSFASLARVLLFV